MPRSTEIAASEPEPAGLQYPEPKEGPTWVDVTPNDVTYSLIMWASDGDCEEEVYINRKEFIEMKRCLGALRGYALHTPIDRRSWDPHPRSDGPSDAEEISQEEIQMVAELAVATDSLFVNLKKRLTEGATVEPGKWELKNDSEDYREFYNVSHSGWYRHGLDISMASDKSPKDAI
jgi:hypothetical protein